MQCPHCRVDFHPNERTRYIDVDVDAGWAIHYTDCSACGRIIIYLAKGKPLFRQDRGYKEFVAFDGDAQFRMVYPKGTARPACPAQVPPDIAEDYQESCLVLQDSLKASAALSRRCLQHILREAGKVKPSDLNHEIEEVIGRGNLPSHIAELLHAVRHVGNFAAHPMKDTATGNILPVEPGEAELNLEVIEALFDFYHVLPDKNQKRKDELNKKLQAAGKPPIK
jgi:hypothetical protein